MFKRHQIYYMIYTAIKTTINLQAELDYRSNFNIKNNRLNKNTTNKIEFKNGQGAAMNFWKIIFSELFC